MVDITKEEIQDIEIPLGSGFGTGQIANPDALLDQEIPLYGIPGKTPPAVQKQRSLVDELLRKIGITARGATTPAVGAMIGSRFGPYGTLAGAGALTIADLTALGLDASGMDIQKYPSDYVKDLMGFPTPETTTEKVLEAGAEGFSGIRPSAGAFKELAEQSTGKTKKLFEFLGGEKNLQALASGSGAAASQYGLETTNDPAKAFQYGLAGGLPFSLISPRATIKQGSQELKRQARVQYKAAKDAGVEFKIPAFMSLKDNIEAKVKPLIGGLVKRNEDGYYKIDPNVGSADVVTGTPKTLRYLNELQLLSKDRVDLDKLQTLRTNINRSIMKASDEEANALRIIRDNIDEFVDKADENALAAFKGPTKEAAKAKDALNKAKDLWRRASRAELMEEFDQQALIRAGRSRKDVSQIMLDRLESLRKRSDYKKMFSESERKAIDMALEGGAGSSAFRAVERGLNKTANTLALGGGYAGMQYLPEDLQGYSAALLAAPYAGAAGAGTVAGALEQRSLAALEDMIRKGKPLNILERVGANLVNPALISGRSATGSLGGMAGLLGI